MMNTTIPDKAEQKLSLLQQADKLARALSDFMQSNLPDLRTAEDADLVFFTDHYIAAMTRLKTISDRVAELNAQDQIVPECEPQCERLRLSTRKSLARIAECYGECRVIVEERKTKYQRDLLEARKRKNLSAYLQSPLIGRSAYQYEQIR